jgi:DNA-binding beta-propeller fold protein YncE
MMLELLFLFAVRQPQLPLSYATVAAAAAAVQTSTDQGIRINFKSTTQPKEGDPVSFTFNISDTTNAAPISGVRPAAWLSLRPETTRSQPVDCTRKVATYLGGDLFARPELDLNAYFVLALNDDASVSVVDPLFGFGGSKLLAMLPLEARGEDWTLSTDQRSLFISMPAAQKIAVADTWRWQITKNIPTGPNPRKLLLANRLWVADDEGVTAIDTQSLVATRIRTGPTGSQPLATRDIAISSDGALVFAAIDNAIAIIDAHKQKLLGRVALDGTPSLLAYSSAGKTLYAADVKSGRIFAIDPRAKTIIATIESHPGAAQLRFAPNGRHALLANPERNIVQVLDAASNRIVQNAEIGEGPDQVTFTPLLAYVRRRASETVLMIPLDQIGIEGKPIGVADFPGGQHGYGEGVAGSLAASIIEAPEGPSVLVANPADKMIYLYKEGMAAPAGGFSNYGRQPRAVLVVDRGLREATAGHYETTVPVNKPGKYDVVFFLDTPRVVACFSMEIAPLRTAPKKTVTRVAAIEPPTHLVAGESVRLRFALIDPEKNARRRADDVRALAFEAPGIWQQRGEVTALPDGTYAFEFIPPDTGMYYVWLESESLDLPPNNSQFLVYEAR